MKIWQVNITVNFLKVMDTTYEPAVTGSPVTSLERDVTCHPSWSFFHP